MLKQFIEQLHSDLEIQQGLEPNEDGTYSLRLDPDIEITLRESPEAGITLFTTVAELPEENTEEYLFKTMIANLFGRETGGSALGLDQEGKKVVLLNFIEETAYKDFYEQLEDFVNYADVWRQETTQFIEQQVEEGN